MATTTLVTGGSGYFGTVLVRRLLAAGHAVRIFDLVEPDDAPAGVDIVQGDIRDHERVEAVCRGAEVVYHCVAQVPLRRDRRTLWEVNVRGTETVVRAAVRAGVKKLVLLSSSAVFGIPARHPVDDGAVARPREPYGWTKLQAEQVALRYARTDGLDVTIVRPRTTVGDGRLGIFQLLFQWIAEGRSIYVLGRGDNVYQFVHVSDLADACIRAAARPGPATYNIGTDRYGTMRETLAGLLAHAGTGSRLRSLPAIPATLAMRTLSALRLAPFAPYHGLMYGRSFYFDLSRATRELGWQPRWSNVEMLCDSYDWYLRHRASIRHDSGRSPHRSPVHEGLLRLLRWLP